MDKLSTFIIIGCDDNGVHTEATVCCMHISDACIAFAEQDIGPIEVMKVAEALRDAGDINNGDLTILAEAKDSGKIEVGEIDRYKELVDMVEARIVDLASLVFNFGQFAEGDEWDGEKHNNYVDGDSVSQWKIYEVAPNDGQGCAVHTYPKGVRSYNHPGVSTYSK